MKYTCEGEDISPALIWRAIPRDAKSVVLICEDPDAPSGTFVHWLVYNLPTTATGLPEGVPGTESLSNGAMQGINDFRRLGYGGPCPPRGHAHRYFFRLHALDIRLELSAGLGKNEVTRAMDGHVLSSAYVMGTYEKR